MKKQSDGAALVFTTDAGTTILNADGSVHFLDDPQEIEQLWQALGFKQAELLSTWASAKETT